MNGKSLLLRGDKEMSEKEELVRRTMRIVKEIFQGTKQAIPYCTGSMEWRFNHMSGYGLNCTHVREALRQCMEEGLQIRHLEYHVQAIADHVHLVSGIFCIAPKQGPGSGRGTPYEILICMYRGMAECVHVHGVRSARLLCRVKGFHEEVYFLEAEEVFYIESSHNNVIWHCREYQVESRDSLKRLERCLPGDFIRIHRGYIVNAGQIFSISGNEVRMANGDILAIPVKNCAKVRRSLLSQAEKELLYPPASHLSQKVEDDGPGEVRC